MTEPNNTASKDVAPEQDSAPGQSAIRRFSSTRLMWLVIVILIGGVAYLTWQNQVLRKPESQNKIVEQANEQLLQDVRNIILLPDPSEEEPVIASVINAESLRGDNPDFYKDAQDGDTLLVYSSKAVIYRKSEHKIINVAPVVLSPSDKGLSQDSEPGKEESK